MFELYDCLSEEVVPGRDYDTVSEAQAIARSKGEGYIVREKRKQQGLPFKKKTFHR